MTGRHSLDQTDELVLYLVRNLTKGVPHLLVEGGGVLTTMLAKLLFLVDVWSMQAFGSQATNFRYTRYKYGPYPLARFEERLEALRGWGLHATANVSTSNGRRYRVYRLAKAPMPAGVLASQVKLVADEVMTTFANHRLEEVLAYVYTWDFVRHVRFGEVIDLTPLKPTGAEALAQAQKLFKGIFSTSISAQHFAALERAHTEPSNENIELTRAMIQRQRKAFRRKESS